MESFNREKKHCLTNIRKGKTRVRNTRLLYESKKSSKIQLEEIKVDKKINIDISENGVQESSCRLCLDLISSVSTPIWGEDTEDYSVKILQCCSITVSKDDTLTFLCQICLLKLESLIEFQQMCQKNDQKLKDINNKKDCQKYTPFIGELSPTDVSNESFAENDNEDNFSMFKDPVEIKIQGKRDKEYHCTDCPMICTDKMEFSIHRKSHKRLSNIQKLTIQNKFLCYVYNCLKEFKYFKDLAEHQKKCHKDQTIASPKCLCQYCGIFLLKRSMRHHIRHLHSSKIPVVCETCGITLSSPSTLYKHILSKHSVKKFTLCPECGKRIAIISLRKHIRRVHSTPHYICQYCDRKFGCGYNLKSHLRTHTGEMPFSCPDCEKTFRHRVTMKHHRLKVHDVNMFDSPPPTFDNSSECQKERKFNNNVTCKET